MKTVQLVGSVLGQFWWPIDQDWMMAIRVDIDRRNDLRDEVLDALQEFEGDSASGVQLTTDSVFVVTRHTKHGVIHRYIPVTRITDLTDIVNTDTETHHFMPEFDDA